MRETLVILLLLPFAILTVLSNQMATFTPPQIGNVAISIPMQVPAPTTLPSADFGGLLNTAMTWLGVPYLWGGCTRRGIDCSCFVRNVLATVGIHAPRTTVEQIRWATPVPRDNIQPGDLVFFNDTCRSCGANPTHVGMYIGGGMMINAGDPVQIQPAFNSHYAGAGRPH